MVVGKGEAGWGRVEKEGAGLEEAVVRGEGGMVGGRGEAGWEREEMGMGEVATEKMVTGRGAGKGGTEKMVVVRVAGKKGGGRGVVKEEGWEKEVGGRGKGGGGRGKGVGERGKGVGGRGEEGGGRGEEGGEKAGMAAATGVVERGKGYGWGRVAAAGREGGKVRVEATGLAPPSLPSSQTRWSRLTS